MSESATATRDDNEQIRRHRLRRPAVIALVGLLVVAIVGTWWALRPGSPTLLGDHTAVGFKANPRPVRDAAGFAGIAIPGPGSRDEVLTFHGTPVIRFSKNTAAATARVAVCVRAARYPTGTGPATGLGTACSEVRYVEDGTRMHWVEGEGRLDEYLIVVVTPTRPGVATIDRVTYDYERPSGESGTDVGTLAYTVRAS
jgi:hypothetical protein